MSVTRRALLALLAVSVAACGRKGEPEPPPGRPSTFPREYPRPRPQG